MPNNVIKNISITNPITHVTTNNPLGSDADKVEYDNTSSGLQADNVQEAIDELAVGGGFFLSGLNDVNINSVSQNQVLTYDSSSSKWINQNPIQDADEINYNNTSSALSATNVQDALDEIELNILQLSASNLPYDANTDIKTKIDTKVDNSSLASVATSGSYTDLSNTPTIPAAQVNSDWNASSGVAEILNKPNLATVATSGSYSDLSNKPSLATVATSGSYSDLSNKPTIPTVNDGTLTIQKNGTTVKTFTANQSGNTTANITCEDKISRTTTNNWSYYKDSSGVYHLTGHISFNAAMTSSLGNGFYRSSVYYWNFPVTLTAISSLTATLQDGSGLSGVTLHSYTTARAGFWIWTLNSGTRDVTLHVNIAST